MSQQRYYTTQLQAGLGLPEETRQLLQVYQTGMSASQLYDAALASGRFPLVTARRLRNIVAECFAPRYMRDPYVAARLKSLVDRLTTAELNQLLFIYTARANLVLADFVREVYWARYSAGRNDLQLEDARTFVTNSVREGKTQKPWSETTIKRISSYLMGCCADYESIIGPYLRGAKTVVIEDPYIRLQHQIQNFVRFCECVLKAGTVKKINLITGYDDKTQLAEIAEKLEELKQSLLELDVELDVKLNPNMHDREIRIDSGWVVKIGRGLDFFQKPGGWFEVGANDLSLRKCLETKVDIFRA